ncbi:hypothetical protein DRQ09_07500 [candidate division KSB1 bacterium]|nr:MAG: hypothetical protein DRQ09_07500 [candidate division KSB1 bacterium]
MIGISSISSQPSIDILVENLLAKERKPVDDLKSKKSSLSSRLSVYNDLKTKLNNLKDLVSGFASVTSPSKLSAKVGVSSNEEVFTADVTSEAVSGVHSIFVSQLAKKDAVVSKRINPDDTTGAQYYNGKTEQFKITVGNKDPVTISISFNDLNETNKEILERIASEINNSGADVTASVVNDTADTVRLSIISNESGSNNQLYFENVGSSDLLDILEITKSGQTGRFASTDTGGGYIEVDPDKLNAVFELNGIQIVKYKNEIDDVLKGVTIKLLKAQKDGESPETLTITLDKDEIKKELENFINDYNEIIKFLNEKTGVEPSLNKRGELAGDFTFLNLKFDIRGIISGYVDGIEDGYPKRLTDLGIKIERDGTLTLDDADELNEALDKGSSVVADIFNGENGIGTKIDALLEDFVSTGGKIDNNKKAINRQIDSIDDRIESYNTRLYIKELALRKQLAEMQKMLSVLNSQQIMLQNSGFLNTGISGYLNYSTGTGGLYY